jgi:4a-hydroxytetrahydrobiopterin dehydratase
MAIKALSKQEIESALAKSPLWALQGNMIARTIQFKGFPQAIEFVNKVAVQAETMDHHPDILVEYNKVTLRLSTHDAGGLSERDFRFAAAVDHNLAQS